MRQVSQTSSSICGAGYRKLFLFWEKTTKGKCIHAETTKAGDYADTAINLCHCGMKWLDYLSGVNVDLPPKKPFNRARIATKKRTVKSKSSIVSFVLSETSNPICKDSYTSVN